MNYSRVHVINFCLSTLAFVSDMKNRRGVCHVAWLLCMTAMWLLVSVNVIEG